MEASAFPRAFLLLWINTSISFEGEFISLAFSCKTFSISSSANFSFFLAFFLFCLCFAKIFSYSNNKTRKLKAERDLRKIFLEIFSEKGAAKKLALPDTNGESFYLWTLFCECTHFNEPEASIFSVCIKIQFSNISWPSGARVRASCSGKISLIY